MAGQEATIEGEIEHATTRPTRRRRLTIVEARVRDSSGTLTAIWFNQAWLADRLRPGATIRLRGALERGEFLVRDYDLDGSESLTRIAPVYPASEALSTKRIRDLIRSALPLLAHLPDPLPADLRARVGLPLKRDALSALHGPESAGQAESGRRRLAFEELLVLQLGLLRRRAQGAAAAAALARRTGRARRSLSRGPPVHSHARRRSGLSRRSTKTSLAPCRWSGCYRGTSAPARRSSRSTPSLERWSRGARER